MLHTMTSGGPFRDSWRTPYNIQTQFFHPNYPFPIFQNSVSYPFFPAPGTFYSPPVYHRPYLEPAENRPVMPFDTSSSARIFLSSPYPYSMQIPSMGNPVMEQGFANSEISSRHLLQNPSSTIGVVPGSNQPLPSFTTDATLRNTYGNESTAGTPVKSRKRARDSSVEETWSSAASVSIPTRHEDNSSGAIDLSINSGVKRQRVDTCFSLCDSVPLALKVNNNKDPKGCVHAPKTGESAFLALDVPSSSCTSTVTVGNISQERQSAQTDLVPIKNESSGKAPLPASTQTTFVSPSSLHGSEMFNQRGLEIVPACSRVWSSSVPETNANRPLIPDILNIPFNPFFPPLLPNPTIGMNWWMDAPFNAYPSGGASNSSSFDFSNPLGIKREEVAPTVESSSPRLDVPVSERGSEELELSPQPDSTNFEAPESEQKSGAPIPVGSNETERRESETTVKIEDIIITRPTEEPKLPGAPRPQIMRNWLLENLERGLKQESVFRISKVRHFDIRGLKLLSRGIEKIERNSGKGRLTGLGLLCALAEERMRDDIGAPDEDSWENNSVESELSEAEGVRIEVDIDQNDNESDAKPLKIGHRRDDSHSPQTSEDDFTAGAKYSEESDSGPPLLIKADDIPVWNSEDQNRPPTLSPNTEQDSQVTSDVSDLISSARSLRDETDGDGEDEKLNEQEEEIDGTNSEGMLKIKQEKEERGQELEQYDYSEEQSLSMSPPDVSKTAVKEQRPVDTWSGEVALGEISSQDGAENDESSQEQIWMKQELEECDDSQEQQLPRSSSDERKTKGKQQRPLDKWTRDSSFEETDQDDGTENDESSQEQLWKKEEPGTGCHSGPHASESSTKDNKRHGKLILRLRRERLKKSEEENPRPNTCVLTTERLMASKFPVKILTVDTGLLYTGQLSAITPPDVYGITIDGERGNRPHIYSREEVLNNSFFEVSPTSKEDLPPGARVCAYWSERCRCLYPGSVSTSAIVDPDPNSVNIEFDDGDSCRINIKNIRLLPENYPVSERNPNPTAKSGKKKKRSSVKEDEESQNHAQVPGTSEASATKEKSPKQQDVIATASTSEASATKEESPKQDVIATASTSEASATKEESPQQQDVIATASTSEANESGINLWKKKKKSHSRSDVCEKHKRKHKHRHRHHKKHSERVSGSTSSRRKKKKAKKSSSGTQSKRSMPVLARKPWVWCGKGFRRPGIKGKARKEYYRAIQRGNERIVIGECAVFLSSGRPDRPFIGRIESMWETWGANMVVKVKWFYHPEETVGCPASLEYPGALFESPHSDENDVQTISHKCEVLPLQRYLERLGKGAKNYEGSTKLYYLAGFYDPTNTSLQFQEGVK